jgi:hypothetical protein
MVLLATLGSCTSIPNRGLGRIQIRAGLPTMIRNAGIDSV